MNNSGGALLTEVYGSDTIKVKKKDKKRKEYIPENKEHIYPEKLEKIDSFDKNFHEKSNIMPYGSYSQEDYFNINKNTKEEQSYGNLFPYQKYTQEGFRKPSVEGEGIKKIDEPVRVKEPVVIEKPVVDNDTDRQPPPQPKVYEEPPKQWAWDKGVKITHQEYKELQEFKAFKANQQAQIIKQQKEKSQESIENFSNINDNFNDVLLFGLLGIFFLIFTDYVYKLGRKSY